MMMCRILLMVLLVAVTGCGSLTPSAPDWRMTEAPEIAGPDVLVLTVPEASPDSLARLADAIGRRHGVKVKAEWPLAAIGVHCLVVHVGDKPVQDVIAAMSTDASILSVQPMQRFQTLSAPEDNDLFRLQRGLRQTRAQDVHPMLTGADVRIGVIDTGIDFSHPDLKRRHLASRDFVGLRGNHPKGEVHGTAVAGVIAADRANARGIVGVAPGAMLMGLRGCWEDKAGLGQCTSFSLVRALNFAILNRLDIVNFSLAGPHDPLLAQLIRKAIAEGIILVAAVGGRSENSFPANQSGVIAVAATTTPQRAQVWAPGDDIISTTPGDGYDFFSGNSVATAHVTGILALLVEADPDLTAQGLARAIAKPGDGPEPPVSIDICSVLHKIPGNQKLCHSAL